MDLQGKRVVVTGGGSGYGKGIAAALVKRGAKVWITGRDEAKLSRTAAKRPDAVACYNDRQAAILVKTLAALGKRVPSDIRVAGFDDVNYAKLATPTLTTAHQPCTELAALACEMLQTRIHKRNLPPRATFLDAQLVVRESTAGHAG